VLGDSIRRRRPPVRQGREEEPEVEWGGGPRARLRTAEGGLTWLGWVGLGAGILVGSFLLGYLLASQLLFPKPETAGAGVPVPALYGMDLARAEETLAGVGLRVGQVTMLASAREREGRVLAQDPLPDQQLRPGAEVELAVSGGPPMARVPPVTGLRAATARDLLERAGFEVDMSAARAGGVPVGAVLRTEPEAGSEVRLPAAITVVVNVEPEPEEAAEPVVEMPDG
jgi:beta-lactam-binding protein with PASTA domain